MELAGLKTSNGKTTNLSSIGVTMILYGIPGIGKTHVANYLPDKRTCYIGLEGGEEPLVGKDIPILSLEMPQDETGLATFKQLVDGIRQGKVINGIDFSKIDTIVFDNISELERFFQFGLMKARKKSFMSIKEYGDSSTKIKEYLRYFRDLRNNGKYVVLIAHEQLIEEEDELGVKLTKTYPQISKSVVKEVMGMFDIVGRMEKIYNPDNPSEYERIIRIEPNAKSSAKCRIPEFVETYGETVPQDITYLFGKINELRKNKKNNN